MQQTGYGFKHSYPILIIFRSIRTIDEILTRNITPSLIRQGTESNEGVLHISAVKAIEIYSQMYTLTVFDGI